MFCQPLPAGKLRALNQPVTVMAWGDSRPRVVGDVEVRVVRTVGAQGEIPRPAVVAARHVDRGGPRQRAVVTAAGGIRRGIVELPEPQRIVARHQVGVRQGAGRAGDFAVHNDLPRAVDDQVGRVQVDRPAQGQLAPGLRRDRGREAGKGDIAVEPVATADVDDRPGVLREADFAQAHVAGVQQIGEVGHVGELDVGHAGPHRELASLHRFVAGHARSERQADRRTEGAAAIRREEHVHGPHAAPGAAVLLLTVLPDVDAVEVFCAAQVEHQLDGRQLGRRAGGVAGGSPAAHTLPAMNAVPKCSCRGRRLRRGARCR